MRKIRKMIKLLLEKKEMWLKLTLAEVRRAWPRFSTPSKSEDSQSMGVLPIVLREIRELNKSHSEKIDLNSVNSKLPSMA